MDECSYRIDRNLKRSIDAYCSANGLNPTDFVERSLRMSLNVAKYGESPSDNVRREKTMPTEGEKPEHAMTMAPEPTAIETTVAEKKTKTRKITIKKKEINHEDRTKSPD